MRAAQLILERGREGGRLIVVWIVFAGGTADMGVRHRSREERVDMTRGGHEGGIIFSARLNFMCVVTSYPVEKYTYKIHLPKSGLWRTRKQCRIWHRGEKPFDCSTCGGDLPPLVV